jgi:hypothetical protein
MPLSASNFEYVLTLSNPEEIEEAKKLIKASLGETSSGVFAAMHATALPTSKLIVGLRRKRIKISAERFDKLIGGCGIKKNDANCYNASDFFLALASLP